MELRPVTRTVKTPAENFTGDVYLNPVFNDDDASLVVGLVRFTPAPAPTDWAKPSGPCTSSVRAAGGVGDASLVGCEPCGDRAVAAVGQR